MSYEEVRRRQDHAEQRRKDDEERREAFAKFLENPLVRLATAEIPGGNTTETLMVVLRAAFDAGFTAGAVDTAMGFLKAVFKPPMRRPPEGEPR